MKGRPRDQLGYLSAAGRALLQRIFGDSLHDVKVSAFFTRVFVYRHNCCSSWKSKKEDVLTLTIGNFLVNCCEQLLQLLRKPCLFVGNDLHPFLATFVTGQQREG
jgi:hypothetical protein